MGASSCGSTGPVFLDRRSDLSDQIRARLALQDEAATHLEAALESLATTLGERLQSALGGAPTGDTPLEVALEGLPDGERVKAAVLAAQLDDLVSLVNAAGLDEARAKWLGTYGKLADLAEDAMASAGVANADGMLDTEAVAETVDALVRRHDDALFGTHARLSGARMLDALHTQVGLESHAEVARRIVEAEEVAIPAAMTEARTRIAEADRYFAEAAVQVAEGETGESYLRVYVGPDDALTRQFCDALVGKAFAVEELAGLSNGMTATHPLLSGGGYNCRHSWVVVHADDLEALGYARGTAEDVARANAAARRRKKKRRGSSGA